MYFHEVISSRIKSIGYYPSEKILEIAFIGSGTYQYIRVSKKTYNSFVTAKSKDRFFDGVINSKYLCRKTG
ncbi:MULTISPECIES: KTSC domain-containing protein [unclassified Citrobacter]|uniref:KTSC domain-containing protein n=1 Tax=unclassified Citrobacter TaxID=2644389 RepID=UPI002576C919|nr:MULTISPECIES: KTSC domain-containing protein [unclassified Citrobacter]MDM2956219.1 KTSC domain-containing protein [Citrobacter sp. CK206]MDM2987177.1 KTSC domain-containing protein [Citrobacter sp. CK196]